MEGLFKVRSMWLERLRPGRCPCWLRPVLVSGGRILGLSGSFTFARSLGELALVLFGSNQQRRQDSLVRHRRQAGVGALALDMVDDRLPEVQLAEITGVQREQAATALDLAGLLTPLRRAADIDDGANDGAHKGRGRAARICAEVKFTGSLLRNVG